MRTTLVTGLWDIGRGDLTEGWSRSFDHYLSKFSELLSIDCNMIIFGDEDLMEFVFKYRNKENTQFIVRKIDWFKNNEFYDKIQKIRNNPDWYNQVGWLSESTQSKLELYNPLVMSKMFLLHDAKILDRFYLLLAQGKAEEARAEYKTALDKAETGAPMRRVIQLKLDALGGSAS